MEEINNAALGRRSFLKGALAAAALTAIPSVLSGCAQTSQVAEAQGTTAAMTAEERAQAIADATFMGGDTNYYGQKLVMGEGPAGQLAPQPVLEWLGWEMEGGALEKVTDNVYVSHTYPLCNSVMFIGETGIVILETSGNCEAAARDLEAYRTVTDKPVKGIIYSHDHYALGTRVYLDDAGSDDIPIIAHENLTNQMAFTMGPVSPAYNWRGSRQYSSGIPTEGPDAPIAGAAGSAKKETYGFVAPNHLISAREPMTEVKIDSLTFRLFPGTSDSPCSLSVYCVEEDTMFSNHLMPTFFNMYTLRGESYRDPDPFIKEIDVVRAVHPNNLIPCQGRALLGRENVDKEFTLYRDSIQFIYDQTIRYMNQGYDPDQIVKAIKVPTFLVEGFFTRPYYGDLEHHVRGVYRGLVGWFGTDVVELHPVSKEFESGKIVEAMGGAQAVVDEARRVLADKQYSWAATLATYVLNIDPENADARTTKADALLEMAHITNSTITRSWYTVAAYDLKGELEQGSVGFLGAVTRDKLAVASRSILLDHLRVTIDPEKALGMNESLTLTLTDENVSYTMAVRNCVGAIEAGKPEKTSVELQMTFDVMSGIVTGETSLEDALASGSVTLVGDKAKLDAILGVCDMEL